MANRIDDAPNRSSTQNSRTGEPRPPPPPQSNEPTGATIAASTYELIYRHPMPQFLGPQLTGVMWVLWSVLDSLDSLQGQIKRYLSVYAHPMWHTRYVASWGSPPKARAWFRECFGRNPLVGEEEELTEQCKLHPLPSSVQLLELLGLAGVDFGYTSAPNLVAFEAKYHLDNLLPAVAYYLVEKRRGNVRRREEVAREMDKFWPLLPPETQGPTQDTMWDEPEAFRTWYGQKLRELVKDVELGRGYWAPRRRMVPIPVNTKAIVPVESAANANRRRRPRHSSGSATPRPAGPEDWWAAAKAAGWRPTLNAGSVAEVERVTTTHTLRIPVSNRNGVPVPQTRPSGPADLISLTSEEGTPRRSP